jgi:hypothetical protein
MKREVETLFSSKPANCHPAYINLLDSRMQHVREHIDSLWRWYRKSGLPDDNFLSEFRLQTCKRLWELETAWLLHNSGFALSNRKAGSDFRCVSNDFAFEVDAVAPGPGAYDHPDFVNEVVLHGEGAFRCSETIHIPERERLELLRVTTVIDAKAKKHVCDLKKGASDASLPFVIALSVVDMGMVVSDWDIPAALKAVFPIGGQCYDIDPATGKFLHRRWQCRPQIKKGTETVEQISTQIFCPGGGAAHYREISALLYGKLDFREHGYPYAPEEHCKHFSLIHNADCNKNKRLKRGSLKVGTEYWIEQTGDNEYVLCETKLEGSEQANEPDKQPRGEFSGIM